MSHQLSPVPLGLLLGAGFGYGTRSPRSWTRWQTIDEYQLIVCPVVLGSGKPLFRDKVDSFDMRLLSTKSFDRGAVLLAYATAEARSAATSR